MIRFKAPWAGIALNLMSNSRIAAWKVSSGNFASCYNQAAFAELSGCNE